MADRFKQNVCPPQGTDVNREDTAGHKRRLLLICVLVIELHSDSYNGVSSLPPGYNQNVE
jgi:hypothetical protein